jgi:ADP-heptose:LPS heptosyltransferase
MSNRRQKSNRPTIVALQMKRVGDLLLTTPALAELRRKRPKDRILLCGGPIVSALAPALPMIDGVLPWRGGAVGSLDALRVLGAARGGVALDFTGTDRSALAAVISGARERRAFSWLERKGFRARLYTDFVESAVRERHTVDHYLDLVGANPPRPPHAVVRLPKARVSQTATFLRAKGIVGPYAIVHPGSARPEKHWAPQRWARLLEHVVEVFPGKLLLTGSGDPHELDHLAQIQRACHRLPEGTLVHLAGETPLLTLAAVIAGANFLVGVDSAAVHFAGAFSVPSLCLYGPTNPYHWRVRSQNALVIQAARRHPTPEKDFVPRQEGVPMDQLSIEPVWHALEKVMARARLLAA